MIFLRKKQSEPAPLVQRPSCAGCSSCFSAPIESMPIAVRDSLEGIREKLVEARSLYLDGRKGEAAAAAKDAKRLIGRLSGPGNLRSSVDSMFAAHVPEAEIQMFIARS